MSEHLLASPDFLPARRVLPLRGELSFYGADAVLAGALGLDEIPYSDATWCHGWLYYELRYPEQLMMNTHLAHMNLVHRREHADFMRENGHANMEAVGAPILYAQFDDLPARVPGSLLVMPGHTVPHENLSDNFAEVERTFVASVQAIVADFSEVWFCISKSCVDRGLWVSTLDRAGIPYVEGAQIDDAHTFKRMASMFSRFETMTTNRLGSHVVYASHFGCRVAVWGPYPDPVLKSRNPTVALYPHLLEMGALETGENMQAMYPHLFCEPQAAAVHRDWAATELGADCVRPVDEVADLLGWNDPWCQMRARANYQLLKTRRRNLPRWLWYKGQKALGTMMGLNR